MFTKPLYYLSTLTHTRSRKQNAEHALSRAEYKAYKEVTYTFCLLALAVNLLKIRGHLQQSDYLHLRGLFPPDDALSGTLRQMVALAWKDTAEATVYTRRIKEMYTTQPEMLEQTWCWLLMLIKKDGALPKLAWYRQQLTAIKGIGKQLGIPALKMMLWIEGNAGQTPRDVLKLHKGASPAEMKKRYHQLLRMYHPDTLATARYPETRKMGEMKVQEINAAYKRLSANSK